MLQFNIGGKPHSSSSFPPTPHPNPHTVSHTHTHVLQSLFLTLVYYCLNSGHPWTEFDIHGVPTYSVSDQAENQAKVILKGQEPPKPLFFVLFCFLSFFYFIVPCAKTSWEGFGKMWSTKRSHLSSGWSLIRGILFSFFN